MNLPLPTSPEKQIISIQGESEETEDGPMFYVLIFLMVLVFSSGICWLFCCGTCVGRDTLRMFGFGRFSPSNNRRRGMRNYRYSPASTEEEEWEMLANANNENNVRVADDEESVLDNDQEEYSALQ
ncbi:unnamed protein product [Rhizophagus irregularis]|uniref:Uncharacterized protein n=1 Tax=Rhizophagus irregularis TaxID=588596 RepID=A0A2N1N2T1_9GLOM|nr:hypothetical protein RhiirC2_713547 [Rhizophagus irregularis]CAB4376809.1 unnamed protein product [Rhizophagus irregularis]CAB5392438.1 unnamed protein product [Rhizophagus irregularis]